MQMNLDNLVNLVNLRNLRNLRNLDARVEGWPVDEWKSERALLGEIENSFRTFQGNGTRASPLKDPSPFFLSPGTWTRRQPVWRVQFYLTSLGTVARSLRKCGSSERPKWLLQDTMWPWEKTWLKEVYPDVRPVFPSRNTLPYNTIV